MAADFTWKYHTACPDTVHRLRRDLMIDPMLCRLLALRGVANLDDARRFFRPEHSHLYDPFFMLNMEAAVARLVSAVSNAEPIMVYGDYDVDGTTAVALVSLYLQNISTQVKTYIPDRYTEGYGLSAEALHAAAKMGIRLMITLDCGIRAVEQSKLARELGIDLIICDHHLPGPESPQAVAILDPKQEDCRYPYKELSGCGVGFKLCQALGLELDIPEEILFGLVDLVAVSSACDIVPLTGENRTITALGLDKLNSTPLPGLKGLAQTSGIFRRLTITDLVFGLGPRINAAGRMQHANAALALLLAKSDEEVSQRAQQLDVLNKERRNIDEIITEECIARLEEVGAFRDMPAIVLADAGWNKGVIGIVASRLVERYYKPTIVFSESDGVLTGSARSTHDFDICAAIGACQTWVERYGGHTHAAGLSVKKAKFAGFKAAFEEVVAGSRSQEQSTPVIEVDAEMGLPGVYPKFLRILRQFEPFGPGNMNPVFVARNVKLKKPKVVGKDHLKFAVQQDESLTFGGIAFGQADQLKLAKSGQAVDLCYSLEENTWQGRTDIQLRVRHFKPSSAG